MRIAAKKTAEWIHATLILAIIMPLLYSFSAEQPDIIGQHLYFKCLVIILPIVATDVAVSKCRSLFSYLISGVIILAVTVAAAWTAAGRLHRSPILWAYLVVLIGETVFLVITRIVERIRRKRDKDASMGEDPSWRPSFDSMRSPSFAVVIFFVVVYALALNLNNPAVCNAALFSGTLYTVITFVHQYVSATETYLSLNKRTCNIPSKRIYGIGNGMLAIFFLLLIIVLLPALFTISNRHYHDLRKSTALIKFDFPELETQFEQTSPEEDPMQALIEQYGEPRPTPKFLIALLYVLEAVIFLFLIAALIKTIIDTFRTFREAADENGDIVEELKNTDEAVKVKRTRISRRKLSDRERVRKEYRKYIRRYRKERPARHESPAEIEKNAGIAESEECKELHRHYELARYGFFKE